MPSSGVTLGLIQMRCGADPDQNFQTAVDRIRVAAEAGAQLICLQELFRSRYFCQSEETACFELAEPVPGPSTQELARLARQLGIVIVASLFERRTAGLYHNTVAILDERGELAGKYRKMHIPDDPLYYEKFYFTPGDLGFSVHSTRFGRVGVLICWDQWFPEAARLTSLKGAQILLYPSAIGWAASEPADLRQQQHTAWETVQRGHAITNGVFVGAVNRVGQEGDLTFWGQSFVCDPFGQVLARASGSAEENLIVHCDFSRIEETRRHWPFLRDRRIDAYEGLEKRFRDGQSAPP